MSSKLSGLSQGHNPTLVWLGPRWSDWDGSGLTGTALVWLGPRCSDWRAVPILFRDEATRGVADSDIAQGDESVNCTDSHVRQIVEKGHPYLFSHLFSVACF